MKSTVLMIVAAFTAVAAVGALAGSAYLGKDAPQVADARPELKIGDQGPGKIFSTRTATWTPKRDLNGYTVTHNLPIGDSRIEKFADFPLMLPEHLPAGSKLRHATLVWDSRTDERLIQIHIEGKQNAVLTEQRVKDRSNEHPEGISVRTEKLPNGPVSRILRSNVDGVGISMAWNPSVSDEVIIKSFQSLTPAATSN